MCVLVLLFGALGGICLAVDSSRLTSLLVRGWIKADFDILNHIQSSYKCCGFQDPVGIEHPPCANVSTIIENWFWIKYEVPNKYTT